MAELHEALSAPVAAWREAGYPHERFDAVGEIFRYAIEGEEQDAPYPQSGSLRFLRAPQLHALETYWYLRAVEGTSHIADLYARLFPQAMEDLTARDPDRLA